MTDVRQVWRKIVVFRSCQNVKVSWNPIQHQVTAELTSGVLGIFPIQVGSFKTVGFGAILVFVFVNSEVSFGT